jgi:hypothetical protein
MNKNRLLHNKPIILSIVLLFLLYYVGPVILRQVTGTPFGWLGSGLISRFVGWWFLSLLLCLYGGLLNRIPKKHRRGVVQMGLPIVLVVLIGGVSLYNSLPSIRARKILENAQFASLPDSATQIKVHIWYTPFSGEEYLRFRADSLDIKLFLDQSAVLEHAEYEEYSDKKMRLFYPRGTTSNKSPGNNYEYISKKPTAPPWYMQEIKDVARRYKIQPKGYNHAGEVIIDEKNNCVFVKLILG